MHDMQKLPLTAEPQHVLDELHTPHALKGGHSLEQCQYVRA
jgi:hypothetical protein